MLIQQILGNIDTALNECCDHNCNDINIRKLMLALRQLETQLDNNHSNSENYHNHHPQQNHQTNNQGQHQNNHHHHKEDKSFFSDNFANILLLGLFIGILVGLLVYIFNKSICHQRVAC